MWARACRGRVLMPETRFALSSLRAHGHLSTSGNMVAAHFRLRDGTKKSIQVPCGTTILEAAHAHGIPLEGACEASVACSTCHVILSEGAYNRLPDATEDEEDMLDQAPCLTPTSRLGCQVAIDETFAEEEIILPPHSLNFYVDGHVPTPH